MNVNPRRNDGINRHIASNDAATNLLRAQAAASLLPGGQRVSFDLNSYATNKFGSSSSLTSKIGDLKVGGNGQAGGDVFPQSAVDKLVLNLTPSDGKFGKLHDASVGPKKLVKPTPASGVTKPVTASAVTAKNQKQAKAAAAAAVEDEQTEESRKKQRLEQNKLSARRSRKRKKIIAEELQVTVDNLNAEYEQLQEEHRMLVAELERCNKLIKVEERAGPPGEATAGKESQPPTTTALLSAVAEGGVNRPPKMPTVVDASAIVRAGSGTRLAASSSSQKIAFNWNNGVGSSAETNKKRKVAAAPPSPLSSSSTTNATPRPFEILSVRGGGGNSRLGGLASDQPLAFLPRPDADAATEAASRPSPADFVNQVRQQQQRQNNVMSLSPLDLLQRQFQQQAQAQRVAQLQQQQPTTSNNLTLLQQQILAAVASQRLNGGPANQR